MGETDDYGVGPRLGEAVDFAGFVHVADAVGSGFVSGDDVAYLVADEHAFTWGRREDGEPFTIRLHGTHLLIAGATDAGKGSYL